ncbi:MAG: hypothetical protein L0Y58_14740 [Verrucomicrobia subdivision 3 bacterium]|nr:hypothetical protein [Limisphaerales bacterium]
MGLFSASKDRLVETMAPGLLNNGILQPYGRVLDIKLNSDAGELDVTIELDGELEPLRIHIQEYELIEEGDRLKIVIRKADTSRKWVTALIRDLVLDRRFELPPEVAKTVARFL